MTDSTDIPALVERVRELDKAATPGPWEHNGYDCHPARAVWTEDPIDDETVRSKMLCRIGSDYGEEHQPPEEQRAENMKLIALYRTAAPVLADEVERLRGLLLKLWYGIDDDWVDHKKNAAVCNEVRETLFPDKEAR